MGQRTQIFLIAEDKKGNKKVEVYHDQWGIGRKMPLAFMAFFTKFYNSSKDYYGKKGFLETHCEIPYNILGISHEYTWFYDAECQKEKGICHYNNDEVVKKEDMPSWDEFQESKLIGEVVRGCCDNNNGAMVIFTKENEGEIREEYEMKVGFLLGSEDEGDVEDYGKAFEKWLTPEEYLDLPINRKYSDDEFVKVFVSFLKYFEIETMA